MHKDYYTCSMHPEIRSKNPGKCPKCGGMELIKASEMASGEGGHSHHHHDHASMMATPEAATEFLKRFFIVTALLAPLLMFSTLGVRYLGLPDFPFRHFVEFGVASIIFYFGLVFFEHAKHEVASRQYGMMTLVSLGIGSGYLFSALSTFFPSLGVEFYLEVSTLIWVLLFGHYLEAKSSTAAGDALQEVAKLLPKDAQVLQEGTVVHVPVDSLKEGDVVIVKPGGKVPADGEIIKGGGSFNESHLTGESKPVSKVVGAKVVAGAISINSTVEIKLTRVGESSTIGQIQKLVSSAKQTKPSAQRLADRASKWLTFSALGVSFLTLFIWTFVIGEPLVFSATLAITVLVIACPHALGLAIPTVSTIATKIAVRNGIFLKDMAKIEVIRKADYVVFDKTGTLTKGESEVQVFEFMDNLDSVVENLGWDIPKTQDVHEYISSIIFSVERKSHHPFAEAVVTHLNDSKGLEVESFEDMSGLGVRAQVGGHEVLIGTQKLMEQEGVMRCADLSNLSKKLRQKAQTVSFVGIDKKNVALIGISDSLKEESKEAVKQLKGMGITPVMITGDNRVTAEVIAKELDITEVLSEVLPEDKYEHVSRLQAKGGVVLMVGDGVNDAPALTQADVGVAIGAGTDVAVESGDVVLTQSNPQHIVRLILLSKKVYRKMVENLFWALGYNIIAIPAAAGLFISFGFRLTPAVGALLMSLSSVVVVVNAFTLKQIKLSD